MTDRAKQPSEDRKKKKEQKENTVVPSSTPIVFVSQEEKKKNRDKLTHKHVSHTNPQAKYPRFLYYRLLVEIYVSL